MRAISQNTSSWTVCLTVCSRQRHKNHQRTASLYEGNPSVTSRFPSQLASTGERIYISWRHHYIACRLKKHLLLQSSWNIKLRKKRIVRTLFISLYFVLVVIPGCSFLNGNYVCHGSNHPHDMAHFEWGLVLNMCGGAHSVVTWKTCTVKSLI